MDSFDLIILEALRRGYITPSELKKEMSNGSEPSEWLMDYAYEVSQMMEDD